MSLKISSVLLLLMLFTTLLSGCGTATGRQATPTPVPQVVSVEKAVFTVERGSIAMQKEILAEVVPSKQDELFFRSSGYVTRVAYKQGDLVKKGEIMAEMQIDDLLNQLEQAKIDLEVSQADLAKQKAQREFEISKAESDVVIWQKRYELGVINVERSFGDMRTEAQLNLDITEQSLVQAENYLKQLKESTDTYQEQAVKRNELAVQRLEKLIIERQIVAPYDCQVLRSSARPGTQTEAFFTQFVIGEPAELVLRAPLDYDLQKMLTANSEVKVRLEAESNDPKAKAYDSKFLPNFLPIKTETEERTTTGFTTDYMYFSLPGDLLAEDRPVGRSLFVTVVLGKKDDVLLLPPAAIRDYKGFNFVIVQDGDRRRRVEINEIGLKGDDLWEINADLKEGDQVLGP